MGCVVGRDGLGKSREEAITVLGDRAQQTRPITLVWKPDRGPGGNYAARGLNRTNCLI
jgi:hypothetical protein